MQFEDIPAFRRNISPPSSGSKGKPSSVSHWFSSGFLFGLLFDTEDGGYMFVRNVGLPPAYTALQPQKTVLCTLTAVITTDSIKYKYEQ
jgi:hypothetical protein